LINKPPHDEDRRKEEKEVYVLERWGLLGPGIPQEERFQEAKKVMDQSEKKFGRDKEGKIRVAVRGKSKD